MLIMKESWYNLISCNDISCNDISCKDARILL